MTKIMGPVELVKVGALRTHWSSQKPRYKKKKLKITKKDKVLALLTSFQQSTGQR